MEYRKDRSTNVPFSLHDSRIQRINVTEDTLCLGMDRIFQYQDDGERTFEGSILFTRTDVEECSILIFDHPFGYDGVKEFSGKRISLEEFQEKYPKAEFEITTEVYHGYDTMFQGWLWNQENDPVFAILNIWNTGDMIYQVGETL